MRMYTDSADAIKAYAEEVNFDLSKCVITEHASSEEHQRGGLTLAFKNYQDNDMQMTVIHNWFDTFDITFWTENKGSKTITDVYFDELMHLFSSLKLAMTGISHQEWLDKLELQTEEE